MPRARNNLRRVFARNIDTNMAANHTAAAAVPSPMPPVPPPHAGPSAVVSRGPQTGRRIALTVDDGTAADVVAGYAEFAQRTGIHLTFSPNGTYNREWAPQAGALRPLR